MNKTWLLAFMMASLALSTTASAEVYRWVDKNGKVQYSDVPPPEANAQTRKMAENSIEVDKLPYEVRKAAETSPITLYTSPDYKEASDTARNMLKARKLPFAEKSVRTTEDAKELVKQIGKAPMVPAMTVGSRVLEGFNDTSWNAALDAAGYPKVVRAKTTDKDKE